MNIEHDMHVHTNLLKCSSDKKAIPDILKRAVEEGLKIIGFSDHMWDEKVFDPSSWYSDQDYNHISQIKELLPEKKYGIKIYLGCETEYCSNGKLGITPEIAGKLDYVLIPFTHFHIVC